MPREGLVLLLKDAVEFDKPQCQASAAVDRRIHHCSLVGPAGMSPEMHDSIEEAADILRDGRRALQAQLFPKEGGGM